MGEGGLWGAVTSNLVPSYQVEGPQGGSPPARSALLSRLRVNLGVEGQLVEICVNIPFTGLEGVRCPKTVGHETQ